MFLLKNDLYTAIKVKELTVLLEESPNGDRDLNDAIEAAEIEIRSYINHRHDVTQVFIDVAYYDPTETVDTGDIRLLWAEAYEAAKTYGLNELVADTDGKVYISLVGSNTGNSPQTSGSEWSAIGLLSAWYSSDEDDNDAAPNGDRWTKVSDPRNALILRFMVDIVLYELHTRIKPRQIPEHRVEKRDDAIKLLKDSANPRNNIYLELPLVDHGEKSGNDLTWNSNDKQQHSY